MENKIRVYAANGHFAIGNVIKENGREVLKRGVFGKKLDCPQNVQVPPYKYNFNDETGKPQILEIYFCNLKGEVGITDLSPELVAELKSFKERESQYHITIEQLKHQLFTLDRKEKMKEYGLDEAKHYGKIAKVVTPWHKADDKKK